MFPRPAAASPYRGPAWGASAPQKDPRKVANGAFVGAAARRPPRPSPAQDRSKQAAAIPQRPRRRSSPARASARHPTGHRRLRSLADRRPPSGPTRSTLCCFPPLLATVDTAVLPGHNPPPLPRTAIGPFFRAPPSRAHDGSWPRTRLRPKRRWTKSPFPPRKVGRVGPRSAAGHVAAPPPHRRCPRFKQDLARWRRTAPVPACFWATWPGPCPRVGCGAC